MRRARNRQVAKHEHRHQAQGKATEKISAAGRVLPEPSVAGGAAGICSVLTKYHALHSMVRAVASTFALRRQGETG